MHVYRTCWIYNLCGSIKIKFPVLIWNTDQKRSLLINSDHNRSLLIRIDRNWSTLICIDLYWSIFPINTVKLIFIDPHRLLIQQVLMYTLVSSLRKTINIDNTILQPTIRGRPLMILIFGGPSPRNKNSKGLIQEKGNFHRPSPGKNNFRKAFPRKK